MCGIAAARPRAGGEVINWDCPEGHAQSDDAPLLPQLFCLDCDCFYEQNEITVRGGARPAAAPAREVSHA